MRYRTSIHLALALALAVGLAGQARPAEAQGGAGSFRQTHPEAARLLDAFEANRSSVFARLTAEPGSALPAAAVEEFRRSMEASAAPSRVKTGLPTEVEHTLESARALRWAILDAYVDPQSGGAEAAVERLVDEYLAGPGRTLAAVPKDPAVLSRLVELQSSVTSVEGHHHGHAGHDMPASGDHSFRGVNPEANHLLWTQLWLENAVFEPLLVGRSAGEREAAMRESVDRFRELLESRDPQRPSAMPTTPAVTPALTFRHPRAAVILNHLAVLENALLDFYTLAPEDADPSILTALLRDLGDPETHLIKDDRWLRLTLRTGIYFQGGPPLGRMDSSDRNSSSPFNSGHGDHIMVPRMPAGF